MLACNIRDSGYDIDHGGVGVGELHLKEGGVSDPAGKYRRSELILSRPQSGSASFKQVYKAIDDQEFPRAWHQTHRLHHGQHVEEIALEIEKVADIEHPNIARTLHVWREPIATSEPHAPVAFFYITEFMDESLKAYMEGNPNPPSIKELQHTCRQILEGLDFIHTRNPPVIHGDLRLGNIYLDHSRRSLKLGDLTSSRLRAFSSSRNFNISRLAETFLPQEVYTEKATEKTDIYSFGMCLLHLVSRNNPYAGCLPNAIYQKKITGVLPKEMDDVAPEGIRQFISLCLTHDPNERPTARQLLSSTLLASCFQQVDPSPPPVVRGSLCTLTKRVIEQQMSDTSGVASLGNALGLTDLKAIVTGFEKRGIRRVSDMDFGVQPSPRILGRLSHCVPAGCGSIKLNRRSAPSMATVVCGAAPSIVTPSRPEGSQRGPKASILPRMCEETLKNQSESPTEDVSSSCTTASPYHRIRQQSLDSVLLGSSDPGAYLFRVSRLIPGKPSPVSVGKHKRSASCVDCLEIPVPDGALKSPESFHDDITSPDVEVAPVRRVSDAVQVFEGLMSRPQQNDRKTSADHGAKLAHATISDSATRPSELVQRWEETIVSARKNPNHPVEESKQRMARGMTNLRGFVSGLECQSRDDAKSRHGASNNHFAPIRTKVYKEWSDWRASLARGSASADSEDWWSGWRTVDCPADVQGVSHSLEQLSATTLESGVGPKPQTHAIPASHVSERRNFPQRRSAIPQALAKPGPSVQAPKRAFSKVSPAPSSKDPSLSSATSVTSAKSSTLPRGASRTAMNAESRMLDTKQKAALACVSDGALIPEHGHLKNFGGSDVSKLTGKGCKPLIKGTGRNGSGEFVASGSERHGHTGQGVGVSTTRNALAGKLSDAGTDAKSRTKLGLLVRKKPSSKSLADGITTRPRKSNSKSIGGSPITQINHSLCQPVAGRRSASPTAGFGLAQAFETFTTLTRAKSALGVTRQRLASGDEGIYAPGSRCLSKKGSLASLSTANSKYRNVSAKVDSGLRRSGPSNADTVSSSKPSMVCGHLDRSAGSEDVCFQ